MLQYENTTGGNNAFINPSNWQGIDVEPILESKNILESGGTAKILSRLVRSLSLSIGESISFNNTGLYKDGVLIDESGYNTGYIDITDKFLYFSVNTQSNYSYINYYDENHTPITANSDYGNIFKQFTMFTYPAGTKYVILCSSVNNSNLFAYITPKEDVVHSIIEQTISNSDNKVPSSIAVKRGFLTPQYSTLTEKTGKTISTAVQTTDIMLKAGCIYNIYFKTDELVSVTDNRQGLYVSGLVKICGLTPAQMYAGVWTEYTPDVDTTLYIRTYEADINWEVKVSSFIQLYPYYLNPKINDFGNRIANIEETIEDKSLFNGSASLVGNNTTQQYTLVNTIGYDAIKDYVGRNISINVGDFVTDGLETAVNIRPFDSQGTRLANILMEANTEQNYIISSDTHHIEIRFYATISYSKSTTGYTYSCDNIKVSIDSVVTKLSKKVDDNTNDIEELQSQILTLSTWNGKNVVIYGDSITALGNGDNPGTASFMYWAAQVNNFNNLYARGIGGQTYRWNIYGWYCKANGAGNGNYVDRYKYDAQGQEINEVVSPINVTQQEIANIEAKYGFPIEVHYGSFCSWDRIKTMIPEAIRETIDLIILCGGTNDHSAVEEVEVEGDMSAAEPIWVANNNTDPTWAADSTYYKGGDYDITTFSGAIASTIMKMLTWCPNTVVVLATPFPRFNLTTKQQFVNTNGLSFRRLCEIEEAVAHFVGTDVIDANGKCGINGVNFENYQMDSVHPNLEGKKMYGRVFVKELIRISNKIL